MGTSCASRPRASPPPAACGVSDGLRTRLPADGIITGVDGRGRTVSRVEASLADDPRALALVRGDLEAALWAARPDDVTVRFATAPRRLDPRRDTVDVVLDGPEGSTRERFDLVVGADGVRSAVRGMVFGPDEHFRHEFDQVVISAILPRLPGELREGDYVVPAEVGRTAHLMAVAEHDPVVFFTFRADLLGVDGADAASRAARDPVGALRRVYGDFAGLMPEILDGVEEAGTTHVDTVAQIRIGSWRRGRGRARRRRRLVPDALLRPGLGARARGRRDARHPPRRAPRRPRGRARGVGAGPPPRGARGGQRGPAVTPLLPARQPPRGRGAPRRAARRVVAAGRPGAARPGVAGRGPRRPRWTGRRRRRHRDRRAGRQGTGTRSGRRSPRAPRPGRARWGLLLSVARKLVAAGVGAGPSVCPGGDVARPSTPRAPTRSLPSTRGRQPPSWLPFPAPRPSRGLLARVVDPFGIAGGVLDRVDPFRHRGRRVWRGAGRVQIGVPAVVRESGEELARAVEKALAAHPQVSWAAVNAALGAVVVGLADEGEGPVGLPDDDTVDDLIDLVEILEEREGGDAVEAASAPLMNAAQQAFTILAADIAGLGVAALGTILRRTPLPTELASAATFVDHQPRLREAVERAVGQERANVLLALSNAAAQALGQGHAGLLVDAAYRAMQVAEARARQQTWEDAEPRLLSNPECAAAAADDALAEPRPVPLPLGPVERHGDVVGAAALAGFAGASALTATLRKGAGVALSTLPKAGRLGREGFATTFGRVLARRGAVVVEPSALRRMDRLDTVVLDAEALTTGVLMLGDLLALPGADGTADALDELVPRVHELFDPEDATAPRRLSADGEHWLLTGLDDIPGGDDPRAVEAGEALRADGATHVLGLRRDDRLTAVVGVLPEPASAAEALAAAARRAGLTLVLGDSEGTGPGIADRAVPGGEALRNSVRALQAAGSGVLVVSRDRQALAAADLGIGVSRADGVAPWGAHVLVGDDLGTAALLIEGVKVARGVSSRSVNLARAGTVLGTIMATAGTAPRGPGLAGLAVNGAAAVSLGNGAWSATELGRRVVVPGVSRTPWHVMPTSTVLARLDVTEGGLTSAEAHRRQRDDPAAAETETSLGRAFLDELNNPLTPVLAGGAVLSAAIGAVRRRRDRRRRHRLLRAVGGVQRVATDRARGRAARAVRRSAPGWCRDGTSRGVGADEVVVGDIIDARARTTSCPPTAACSSPTG